MATLQDIKRRINSVTNTRQITKAMKLVAAAKLRRAQEAVEAARPYSSKMMELMESLSARVNPESQPLLRRSEVANIMIVVFTGDKGLCGPFNSSITRATQKVIAENEGKGISLFLVGKKAVTFFRRRPVNVTESVVDFGKRIGYTMAEEIAEKVIAEFSDEHVDLVYMIYNRFKNVVVQETQEVSLLPVKLEETTEDAAWRLVDYIYEPSAEEILDGILSRYVVQQLYHALLESNASEQGARMTAMDAATKNATEMIADLTLAYNRARQAAITTELIEVVTGADALEG